jgi:hypothetical protein
MYLVTAIQAQRGEEYSSYLFLTSALDEGEWSASRHSRALPPGNNRQYPLDRRLGGPQSWSGLRGCRKNPTLYSYYSEIGFVGYFPTCHFLNLKFFGYGALLITIYYFDVSLGYCCAVLFS